MNTQREAMRISEVQEVVAQLTQEQQVPDHLVEAARGTMQHLCCQAVEHGLTAAEVVNAMLRPRFRKEAGLRLPHLYG